MTIPPPTKLKEKHMKVQEIMTNKVVTIENNRSVFDACQKFSKNHIGCLIVIEKDHPVGIVTERDIIQRVTQNSKNPKSTLIQDIMSKDLIMVPPDATIEFAAQTLMKHKIKKLPVVKDNAMIGIVTVTDIAALVQDMSKILVSVGYPFIQK